MAGAIVTNDYRNLTTGAIRGRIGRELASGGRGRGRMTIEIQSEPIVHVMDSLQLGHGPAQAAARALADRVRAISQNVAESTQVTRARQEQAYAAGKPWARRRFGGPRLGERPPRDGELRMFNHSDTFASSIVGTENKTERTWTINVAANRLDPRTSRTPHEFGFITETLRRLIPAFDDPAQLARLPEVNAAVQQSIADMIITARKLNDKLRDQRFGALLSLLRLDGIVGTAKQIVML